MGRFWLFYYLAFGPRYTRWALLLFVLVMGFFFFCFVHEAFDARRPIDLATTAHHSKTVKPRIQAVRPQVTERQKETADN